jgi:glycosyltransferase involved in cell wall biosynthesis
VDVISYKPLNTPVEAPSLEISSGLRVRRIRWFSNGLFYKLERNPLAELVYLTPMLFWFPALLLLRTRDRPDVIHSHGLTATAAAVLLGKIFRIRVVSSLHTIYRLDGRSRIFSKSVTFLLSKVNRVLVPAQGAKRDLQSAGLSPTSIDVYTYWVDQELFRPRDKNSCRRSLGLSRGPIVLFVGRLIESKGVLPLLAAAKRLPACTFLFAGDGPLGTVLENAAAEYPNVIFLGRKKGFELSQIYNCADILWGSADEDYVGRVTIEALSCGVPVMIPDRLKIFGIERRVSDDLLGPSVSIHVRDSAAEIEVQLRKLFENPIIAEEMSKRSREIALARYSQENAKIIERSYESASCP